ncbi:MAG: GNAT family N-acetyltransferase, partial [Usitatibacter sp.]
RQMIAAAIAEGRSILGATESKELLAAFRIPVLRSVDVANAAEAVFAANAAGYPVVMKIRSPDITHKSDVGGVHLGIPDAIAVREAFEAMMAEVKRRRPEARIDGVSIEPMLNRPYARELMAGIARDPVFGPAIMFGAGGIAIEVLRDRVVALPPLNATLVEDMIHGTKVSRMLDRFRNLPPVDRAALDAVLLRVSEMATELPELVELDINPLVADERGALALDARIVVRAAPPGLPRYGHLAIHPYPQELEGEARLRDGTAVLLRPIRPEDAPLEEAFIATLSPDTMRLRFLSAMRSLTPAMLARFTQIDYDREMAFVALVGEGEDTREIGVGRYATLPDGRTCEYAIVLADAWHGRGLGEIMMRRLVEVARARGLETMVGDVLASNDPMLRLCAKLGFASAAMPDDPGMRRVTLDLRGNQR